MFLLNLLVSVLNRGGEQEKQPWQKGNSELISVGILPEFTVTQIAYRAMYEVENISTAISDLFFNVQQVYYSSMYETENLTTNIADISFIVTKVGSNPL